MNNLERGVRKSTVSVLAAAMVTIYGSGCSNQIDLGDVTPLQAPDADFPTFDIGLPDAVFEDVDDNNNLTDAETADTAADADLVDSELEDATDMNDTEIAEDVSTEDATDDSEVLEDEEVVEVGCGFFIVENGNFLENVCEEEDPRCAANGCDIGNRQPGFIVDIKVAELQGGAFRLAVQTTSCDSLQFTVISGDNNDELNHITPPKEGQDYICIPPIPFDTTEVTINLLAPNEGGRIVRTVRLERR